MYKITFLITLLVICFSCSNEDDKEKKKETSVGKPAATDLTMQNNAISFISNQDDVLAYGSIKLNQLLNKAYYDSDISKSDLVSSAVAKQAIEEIERIKSYIDVGIPIYYLIKGSDDINNLEFIAFGGINDSKAIIKEIKTNMPSLSIKEHKNFTLLQDREIALAVSKDRFIVRGSSNRQARNLSTKFKDYFNSFSGKADPTVKAIFDKSKDATIAYDYGKIMSLTEQLMLTENIDITELNWMKDIDLTTSMDLAFEKGSISISTNLYSEEMQKWNLMSSSSKKILTKLGPGKPSAGFLANVNVDEIQKLWNVYYPDGIINTLMEMNLGPEFENQIPEELAAIEATLMKDGLKSFFGGEIGIMLYGIPNEASGQLLKMSAYMNIGSNIKDLIDENDIKNGIMIKDEFSIDFQDDHISVSSKNHAPDGKGPELSSKFSNFGKAPISAFIDLAQIPTNDLPRELSDFESLIEMLDFIDMEFDMSGGHVTLHLKDKSKNALTQIADIALEIGTLLLREMTGISL